MVAPARGGFCPGSAGADRGALEWAIRRDVPHGGWCPKGRRAEDGTIPPQFRLEETPSAGYPERTEWNVRDDLIRRSFAEERFRTTLIVSFAAAAARRAGRVEPSAVLRGE